MMGAQRSHNFPHVSPNPKAPTKSVPMGSNVPIHVVFERAAELSESISSLSCLRLVDTATGVTLDCSVAELDVADCWRHKYSAMQMTYMPQSQPENMCIVLILNFHYCILPIQLAIIHINGVQIN